MAGNFTKIDEEFICENCGKKVTKLGYSCRNHCPYCLHSKHVDINPGDRAEECQGDLEPVGAEIDSKKGFVIIFRCKKCGKIIHLENPGMNIFFQEVQQKYGFLLEPMESVLVGVCAECNQ